MSSTSDCPENAAPAAPLRLAALAKAQSPGVPLDEVSPPPPPSLSPSSSPLLPFSQAGPDIPSHADHHKYPRGPLHAQRSPGPSLLTQALATARGIPKPKQPDLSPPGLLPSPDISSTPPTLDAQSPPNAADEPLDQGDSDSLTPRGSPSGKSTMAPANTVVTMSAFARPKHDASLRNPHAISSMFGHNHMQHIGVTRKRSSSERTGREMGTHEWDPRTAGPGPAYVGTGYSSKPHLDDFAVDSGQDEPSYQPSPPCKLDHRLSTGLEKAWSIGTRERSSDQDGQVEKSITEVLAGVEPNARSRKASHSLRFFKEGLPNDQQKRKDSRNAAQPRQKHPGPGDAARDSSEDYSSIVRLSGAQLAATEWRELSAPRRVEERTRSYPSHASETSIWDSPKDKALLGGQNIPAGLDKTQRGPVLSQTASVSGQQDQKSDTEKVSTVSSDKEGPERHRRSDSTEAGDVEPDGDDSEEENISSAVFVPHQGVENPQDKALEQGAHPRPTPRSHPRAEDFHPWLVKADEPEEDAEVDDNGYHDEKNTKDGRPVSDEASRVDEAGQVGLEEGVSITANERGPEGSAISTGPSWPAAHGLDDQGRYQIADDSHMHDHQLAAPEEPLEAIELIPYNHQVGGHTTIWRFSKRAVCKKLNNRENEFYETVEKHHPDLLAFLPRYIGVLNVTYRKQPRRKLALKQQDEGLGQDRKPQGENDGAGTARTDGAAGDDADLPGALERLQAGANGHHRVISQSLQSTAIPSVPTVTFVDNQHILPRNLLESPGSTSPYPRQSRSASILADEPPVSTGGQGDSDVLGYGSDSVRPGLESRHAISWGYTTVNKKLRNEVFNDAFLKDPVAIQQRLKGRHHIIRHGLRHTLRPSTSDSTPIMHPADARGNTKNGHVPPFSDQGRRGDYARNLTPPAQSRLGHPGRRCSCDLGDGSMLRDVTGTSAPELELVTANASPVIPGRKRRYSGISLRRKPRDVQEGRGDLKYFEEPDDSGYRGDNEDAAAGPVLMHGNAGVPARPSHATRPSNGSQNGKACFHGQNGSHSPLREMSNVGTATAVAPSRNTPPVASPPMLSPSASEFKRVARPVNPKEAQTQSDSRVEYFLLLEDLTAGMKRPCIMDLKMGTRQYGVEATPQKRKSQTGKCAKTTSRRLGVRVCGLQVWDVATQSYVFKDKYYGRDVKAGREFQDCLTRFLYDGIDRASILRHVPNVLRKLDRLEVIVSRLHGYRFYAASLLMFYDGDASLAADGGPSGGGSENNGGAGHDTLVGGSTANVDEPYYSTTDFATDTEEGPPGAAGPTTPRSGNAANPGSQQPWAGTGTETGAAANLSPLTAPRGRKARSRREIDFKMADFANSVTARVGGCGEGKEGGGRRSPAWADKACPPQHPHEPDRGFLRGLRSLRRYFLRIQRETRAELGLMIAARGGVDGEGSGSGSANLDGESEDDSGTVSV